MSSLFSIDKPFMFQNKINSWPASLWTPAYLAETLKELKTKFRIGKKESTKGKYENKCLKSSLYVTLVASCIHIALFSAQFYVENKNN